MTSAVGSTSKFFISAPVDKYWNPSYPPEIIEAEGWPERGWGSLKVLAPESFASDWPSVCSQFFIECSGPVRSFDRQGYIQFIHSIRPDIPLPKGWSE